MVKGLEHISNEDKMRSGVFKAKLDEALSNLV